MSANLILLLLLSHSTSFLTSKRAPIHRCQVESYTEKLNLRNCLSTPISIQTTRCRGQCYSEDYLVYDWRYSPGYSRHQRHLQCCSPNSTQAHEIQILCENKQFKTIQYRLVTHCQCQSCTDRCSE